MVSADIAEKERFVVLDGMRGLAAFAVITDHVSSPALGALLPGRYLAVDFFFVLSGFVLTHVYARRLTSGMGALGFLRARLIRLYPLYLVALAIGAVLAALYAAQGWRETGLDAVGASLLFAFFLLPTPPAVSIWPNAPFPINGPSWSLFFELFINVVFALVARWLTPALCLFCMVIAGIALAPTAFLFGRLDGGFAWDNFIAGFPRVTFGFFAGVWLYHMRARWKAPALPAWAAYLALLAVFAVPATGVWRSAYDLIAVIVLFPTLVALSARAQAQGRLLRASAFLGLVSYGVYVLHVPIWGWLQLTLDRFDVVAPGFVHVLMVAVVAGFAAWILHIAYDAPLRRVLGRRRSAPAPE